MKHTLLLLIIMNISGLCLSQNIGIGTANPTGKLQINHRSTAAPGIKLLDSSGNLSGSIQFQNLNYSKNIMLRGFSNSDFSAGQYLDVLSDSITTATFTGRGYMGIRKLEPQYPLDVNGNINTNGMILTNGVAGQAGQVLTSNGAGDMEWRFPGSEFRNFRSYTTPGATTFTVPAGVTKIKVELWGGGAGASDNYSGGSGAYIMAVIDVVAGQTCNIGVGAGGAVNTSGIASEFSRNTAPAIILIANGGQTVGLVATFSATGTTQYFGLSGRGGGAGHISNYKTSTGEKIVYGHAPGADAPLMPGSGGRSGQSQYNLDFSSPTRAFGGDGSQPGGGGGLGNGRGGAGMVVVYW